MTATASGPELYLSRPLTDEEEARAAALHDAAIVVDTCGAVQPRGPEGSLDESIAELRQGGVDCVGLTLAADVHDFRGAIELINWWNRRIRAYSRDLALVQDAAGIRAAKADGRIAVYYLFQNGKPFEDEPGYVETFRALGVTSSQLTYNWRNHIGDGYYEPSNAGISLLGERVIAEMNQVGMLVDLSHAGERTQQTAIQASARPVYFSHTNTTALFPTGRNATDETLRLLAANGGMINAMGLAVSGAPAPTVAEMVAHAVHAVEILGPERVGFATDCLKGRDSVYRGAFIDDDGYLNVQYEGSLRVQRTRWGGPGTSAAYPWWVYPKGIETYGEYRNITRELVVRGFSDSEILGMLGGNFVEFYEKVVG